MIPRIVLCEEHPKAMIRVNSSKILKLSISKDLLHIDIEPISKNSEESDCLLYIPYRGIYHMNDLVEPLKSGDISYVEIVLETRRTLKMYEIQISQNMIQMVSHSLDDSFFRGYVVNNSDKIGLRILKKLIHYYQSLTLPIYCCLIKTIPLERYPINTSILTTYMCKRRKNIDLYYSSGRCVLIRKVSESRYNISLIFSISYSTEFLNMILEIFKRSRLILDLKLGRVDKVEGIKTILDIFSRAEYSTIQEN